MNSLSHILEPQFGKLYNINRLDRLTSGLVLLAKSSAVAKQLGKCLMQRDSCQKIYLARVKGKFPLMCPLKVNERVGRDPNNLPCKHGEWILSGSSTTASPDAQQEKPPPNTMEEMKKTNALRAWITDTSGVVDRSGSLQQLSETRHSIDSSLEEIRQCADTDETKESPQENSSTEAHNNIRWLQLACPTRVAKPKDGICEAGSFDDLEASVYEKTVKPAQTAFAVVNYDEDTDSTVLLCRPMTGRTHQIRLHLQFLGHPIANDPNYGGDMFFGDAQGQLAFVRAKSKLDDLNSSNCGEIDEDNHESSEKDGTDKALPATSTDTPATQAELNALAHLTRNHDETEEAFIKRTCVWCARSRGEGEGNARTTLEFLCRSRGIFLHALAYYMNDESGQEFHFQAAVPPWAH
jgi:hypothetical protein